MTKAMLTTVAGVLFALAPISAAQAAPFINYTTDVGGTFGNTAPIVAGGGLFSDAFNFTTTSQTIGNFFINSTGGSVARNVNFSAVTVDGTAIPIILLGAVRSGTLIDFRLPAGVHQILVSGNTGTNGSFSGFFSLTAVPEASTWAMMIAGFGLVGAGMRRRGAKAKISFA